jgi:hypothetical protein
LVEGGFEAAFDDDVFGFAFGRDFEREHRGSGGGGRLGVLGLGFVEDFGRLDAVFTDLVDLTILLGGEGGGDAGDQEAGGGS